MDTEKIIKNAENNIRKAINDYWRYTDEITILNDISSEFICKLAKDSTYAKQSLRELFSKSPVWDEKLDALVINGTRTHDPDYNRVYELAKKILWEKIYACEYGSEQQIQLYRIINFFANPAGENHDPDIEAEGIAAINAVAPKAYVTGKKLSRIFKAICVELGIADETAGSEFQRLYAQFADELSAKKISFKLFVSINPAHFLTMSNPKYDSRGPCLTSCHSLNSTELEYNNGCVGYARDEVTFIVFTVDDPTNPETLNNRKTTRQIYAYKPGNGLLLQSRMYNTSGGVNGASEETKLYRDLIQREISMLEGAPNLWKTYPYLNSMEHTVKEGKGFGGYSDWTYENFGAHISIRADHEKDFEPLTVGTWGMCICCGQDNDYGLYCGSCIPEDEDHRCNYCDEYVRERLRAAYNSDGNEVYVCSHCLEKYFTYCEHCEVYHDESVINSIDGLYICDECRNSYYKKCENCGEYHKSEDLISVCSKNGNEIHVCRDCYEDCCFTGKEAESA